MASYRLKHDIQVAQLEAMKSALEANQKLHENLKTVGEQIAQLMQDNERHIASITQLRKSTGMHLFFWYVLQQVWPMCSPICCTLQQCLGLLMLRCKSLTCCCCTAC